MDETAVRDKAQAHGDATVAGDLRTAGADLTKEAMAQAGGVMAKMPKPLTAAEIRDVTSDGDAFLARIAYLGEDSEAIVVSRWEERDGRPKIVDLAVE